MAPTESTILSNYLLAAAQLPDVVTLEQFTALFPRSSQRSPAQIKALYRDLQRQRKAVVDSVADSIEAEAKRGKQMRREVVRARREAEHEADDEKDIERAVCDNLNRHLESFGSDPRAAVPGIRGRCTQAHADVDPSGAGESGPRLGGRAGTARVRRDASAADGKANGRRPE